MPMTLTEYAADLELRQVILPQPTPAMPVRATPSCQPLAGIRVVLWDVYGTLLRITDGRFTLQPAQEIRLQVALDKTIHEFNMWNYLYRKPGPPWQSLIGLYQSTLDRLKMQAAAPGDTPEVNLTDLWAALVVKLLEKDYPIDQARYGAPEAFAEKVAFFFHSCLQGLAARDDALSTVQYISEAGMLQGCLADGQSFTSVQLQRCLERQGPLPPMSSLFRPSGMFLSTAAGVRKPSLSLFRRAVNALKTQGISPDQIVHISCRLQSDLVPAAKQGMKTALLAAEQEGLEVSKELLRDSATRPDRLLTSLDQVRQMLPPVS